MRSSCARRTRTRAISRIDATAARKAPGVLAVLTGADVKADGLGEIPCMIPVTNADGSQRGETPRPLLATDRVRHVGDPVALVVAETLAQAKDAAELIEIDYDPLPAVADTYAATQAGRAAGLARHQEQRLLRHRERRCEGGRRRVRARDARREARAREQPARREPARAARRGRRLRPGDRPLDALHADAGAARHPRPDRRPDPQAREPRSCAWSPATSAARSA